MAAFGGKMKKVWILLLSSLLFINCAAAQINSFQDLNVQYEDAGKKHLCVSVNAYSETAEIFDQAQKLKNMDISVLYNILLFDYDTFEEEGWVF